MNVEVNIVAPTLILVVESKDVLTLPSLKCDVLTSVIGDPV